MAARVRFRSLRLRMVLASALTLAAPLVVVCVGGVTMYGEVDSRETLAQLSLALLPMAIGLALFLGWRMSRPIDSLKRQLTDRASDAACREPVALERDDEFGKTRVYNVLCVFFCFDVMHVGAGECGHIVIGGQSDHVGEVFVDEGFTLIPQHQKQEVVGLLFKYVFKNLTTIPFYIFFIFYF